MIIDERTIAILGSALIASLVLTPIVRSLARQRGLVNRPRADRWAKKPTALYGGIAIYGATVLAALPLVSELEHGWLVLAASTFVFVLGLADDRLSLKPYQKLVGQILGGCLVIFGGVMLPWTTMPLVNMAVTLLWLVGITNAFNLLDNMDGLAAGVAAIAAAFLAVQCSLSGQAAEALLLAAFAAVLVGFLVYNFNPASIFMGDCGSMFIGFFLASTALSHVSGGRSRSLLSVLAVPVLLLLIPIFDTTLVTVMRKLSGRPASQGGRDHTSHRLVALGLSERRAVCLLYGLALMSGVMALLVHNAPMDVSVAAISAFTMVLTFLGVHLARVKVYEVTDLPNVDAKPLVSFLVNLSYKRRVFEVLLDVVLIALAYYVANICYYGPLAGDSYAWALLGETLPLLVILKLSSFLVAGVYRGLWRYVDFDDLYVYVKAVALGSAASVTVLLFLFRFESFSRVVFLLDALLLLALLTASRGAFRLLRSILKPPAADRGRRALIYGAGDAGVLLLKEMRNNIGLQCMPVGFADDDPIKAGTVIHGLPVFGGNGSLRSICQKHAVEEVVISSAHITDDRVCEIRDVCKEIGVILRRMHISFETLQEEVTEESIFFAAGADTNVVKGPGKPRAEGAA